MNHIKHHKEKIELGGAVTIENFLEAIKSKMPQLIEILQRFGSPQIRNQGTIGGNLCTSSPIGDIAPILLVLNSDLKLDADFMNWVSWLNVKNNLYLTKGRLIGEEWRINFIINIEL